MGDGKTGAEISLYTEMLSPETQMHTSHCFLDILASIPGKLLPNS